MFLLYKICLAAIFFMLNNCKYLHMCAFCHLYVAKHAHAS